MKVLRDLICDHDHFGSLRVEKKSLENISQGSKTRGSNAPLQPQHGPNRDPTYLPLQGAWQGPAAFVAGEITVHTLCMNVGAFA